MRRASSVLSVVVGLGLIAAGAWRLGVERGAGGGGPGPDELAYEDSLEAYRRIFHPARDPASAGPSVGTDELVMPAGFRPGEPFSVIREPSVLLELERRGFSLADHLGLQGGAGDRASNAALLESPLYAGFLALLEADLGEVFTQETARSPLRKAAELRATFRLFDPEWLRSPIARYELVGVVNRLDRVSFDPLGCGELRFVFRLSYDNRAKGIYSRLPMTVMVKYAVAIDPDRALGAEAVDYRDRASQLRSWESCKRFVRAWVYPRDKAEPAALVDWMVSPGGPVGDRLLRVGRFARLETNLQALRVPSGARPELAGHGVYLLRVLERDGPDGRRLKPVPLENTLDAAKLAADPALKAELAALLGERRTQQRLDAGILLLPEKFLATRALSYSPFGVSRRDNRLLEQVFTPGELRSIFARFDESPGTFVRSSGAAARRVNDLSCVGCHQGRATAGFHFLGIDRASTHPMNALIYEGSGHFEIELKRRARYLARALKGHIPDPRRDFSIAPPRDEEAPELARAGHGHFCGLPGGGFEHWRCEDGLACVQTDEAAGEKELGKCFPARPRAGDPCMTGPVRQADHRVDRLDGVRTLRCGDASAAYSCSSLALGHPSGTCTTTSAKGCSTSDPLETCGFFAGVGFNGCVQKMLAGAKTFVECAEGYHGEGRRGRCNERKACRNDYVCVRTGRYDAERRDGACAPSYFLFQVRLDGHPKPGAPGA